MPSPSPSPSPSPAKVNMKMKQNQVLEITLISAQGLKPPSSPRRRFQTYAVTWIHSDKKLRTRVDKVGGENPTWNDKFLFRVTPEFLASETSGVSVAIFSVGTFRDHLIGTVRFLISNTLGPSTTTRTAPCFSAVQIQRPSGRFHGVMNVAAMVIDGAEFPALKSKKNFSAIGYRDLMGEKIQPSRKKTESVHFTEPQPPKLTKNSSSSIETTSSNASCEEGSLTESLTDGTESVETASSSSNSSPRTVTALKEWNGVRGMAGAGNKGLTVGSGFLCCLVANRNVRLSPSSAAIER
ncbi:hypothetical protein RIF29_24120 [Crotalaria pallida]|uniref:C2 domain-containing protein n=1 Tax=Crotalaria pallida TaxID=3830 RepID=A0AAN9EPB0_CROPI